MPGGIVTFEPQRCWFYQPVMHCPRQNRRVGGAWAALGTLYKSQNSGGLAVYANVLRLAASYHRKQCWQFEYTASQGVGAAFDGVGAAFGLYVSEVTV